MKFPDQAFDRFAKKKPVSVMARAAIENVLSSRRLDEIFEKHASVQYSSELMFSTVADLMGQVVLRIHPGINAAFVDRREEIAVTVKSVYDKLKGVEPDVSRELVRQTADRMQAIIRQSGGQREPVLAGYRTKIVDGNHLRRTDRRIGELRDMNIAPLPGKSLVIYDPQYDLAIDVLPCEDGHAQERSLLPELLQTIERRDLLIADRNFCTVDFLAGIGGRGGFFVIRQHGGLPFELKGRRKLVGNSDTGKVYEQAMQVTDRTGQTRNDRRITVVLNKPTRDGDAEIHVVTNLPVRVGAIHIAEIYAGRWTIETAFQKMAESLEGEIKSPGYPKAALFGFCMALVSYNVLSVVRGVVAGVHGREAADQLSTYYLCHEVASTAEGMSVILEADYRETRYGSLTPSQLAAELRRLSQQIDLKRYQKGKWKPKPKPMNKKNRGHQSTFRILEKAKQKALCNS